MGDEVWFECPNCGYTAEDYPQCEECGCETEEIEETDFAEGVEETI